MQQRPGDFLRRARKGVPPEYRAEAGTGRDSLGLQYMLHQVELTYGIPIPYYSIFYFLHAIVRCTTCWTKANSGPSEKAMKAWTKQGYHLKPLDDGWPESVEEHVTLL